MIWKPIRFNTITIERLFNFCYEFAWNLKPNHKVRQISEAIRQSANQLNQHGGWKIRKVRHFPLLTSHLRCSRLEGKFCSPKTVADCQPIMVVWRLQRAIKANESQIIRNSHLFIHSHPDW